MKRIDERFTDLADRVSEGMGRWWVSAFFLVLILVWLASGPILHWSDSWQLLVNTPTTIMELFIGFLLAAAANRSERHARRLMQQIERMEREHGEMVREIHAHVSCDGHTHIGATPQVKRHAVRGPDGRYTRVAVVEEAEEKAA